MEVITIDSPQLTVSGIVGAYTHNRNMKMALSSENGLHGVSSLLCVDSHVKFG